MRCSATMTTSTPPTRTARPSLFGGRRPPVAPTTCPDEQEGSDPADLRSGGSRSGRYNLWMDELTEQELALLLRARDEGVIVASLYADGKRLIRDFHLNIDCEDLAERGFLRALGASGDRARTLRSRWTLARRGEQILLQTRRPRQAA